MQTIVENDVDADHDCSSEIKFAQDFTSKMKIRDDSSAGDEDGEDEVEDEEEFSFMCSGAETSPIAAEDAFVNGQIKPILPLFNNHDLHENLPLTPSVKKVFVETIEEHGRTTPDNDEAVGPYCEWTSRKAVEARASPEICKKSNSTGSSKIWRFKDLVGRSNSDGRDTFVFLNNALPPLTAAVRCSGKPASSENRIDEKSTRKVSRKLKTTRGKAKTPSLSAHEVYLRSKAKEVERRRTYLPYRPEVMGFFTTYNGGLSRNVHPF